WLPVRLVGPVGSPGAVAVVDGFADAGGGAGLGGGGRGPGVALAAHLEAQRGPGARRRRGGPGRDAGGVGREDAQGQAVAVAEGGPEAVAGGGAARVGGGRRLGAAGEEGEERQEAGGAHARNLQRGFAARETNPRLLGVGPIKENGGP